MLIAMLMCLANIASARDAPSTWEPDTVLLARSERVVFDPLPNAAERLTRIGSEPLTDLWLRVMEPHVISPALSTPEEKADAYICDLAGAVTAYALGDWIAAALMLEYSESVGSRTPTLDSLRSRASLYQATWALDQAYGDSSEVRASLANRMPMRRSQWIPVLFDGLDTLKKTVHGHAPTIEPSLPDGAEHLVPYPTLGRLAKMLADSLRDSTRSAEGARLPWPFGQWWVAFPTPDSSLRQPIRVQRSDNSRIRLCGTPTVRTSIRWPNGSSAKLVVHSRQLQNGTWETRGSAVRLPYDTYLLEAPSDSTLLCLMRTRRDLPRLTSEPVTFVWGSRDTAWVPEGARLIIDLNNGPMHVLGRKLTVVGALVLLFTTVYAASVAVQ